MIEPLITQGCASPQTGDKALGADAAIGEPNETNNRFLKVLTLVQKIVRGKLSSAQQAEAHDLTQIIALRLWSWRVRYPEKIERMTNDEWQQFAARTALNEIVRHFSRSSQREYEPLETAAAVAADSSVAGETETEASSLAGFVWQGICRLTVRQRRALVLSSPKLTILLLQKGVTDRMLSDSLEVEPDKWENIKDRLPLSDSSIAELRFNDKTKQNRRKQQTTAQSVKKARHEARVQLQQWTNK